MSPASRFLKPSSRFNIAPARVVISSLRTIWVLTIMFYELGAFIPSLNNCKWPSLLSTHSNPTADKDVGGAHMIVVADPDIVDKRLYPGHLGFLNVLTQYAVELNLRKAWRAAQFLNPDAAVFLGDVMDHGRSDMPYKEYDAYFARFKSIFRSPAPHFFVPGNHDTDLTQSTTLSTYARERYVSTFGEFNRVLSIAEHSVIFLDAPSLLEEDNARIAANSTQYSQWKPRAGGAVQFIKSFGHNVSRTDERVILFSHIPMHRAGDSTCRSANKRNDANFDGEFQSTLSTDATTLVLDKLQPSLIVTAEEHHYCEFTHTVNGRNSIPRTVREVTVQSFNMMSINRPALHLLTLIPPHSRPAGVRMPTHADAVCLLPDQLRIYICIYLPLSILTIVVLLLANYHRVRTSTRYRLTHARAESSGIWGRLARMDDSRSSGHSRSLSSAHTRGVSASSTPVEPANRWFAQETSGPTIMGSAVLEEEDFVNIPEWCKEDLQATFTEFEESHADDVKQEDEVIAIKEKKYSQYTPRRFWGSSPRRPLTRKGRDERSVLGGTWRHIWTTAIYPIVLSAAISWWMW